jgi:hypothetical protein
MPRRAALRMAPDGGDRWRLDRVHQADTASFQTLKDGPCRSVDISDGAKMDVEFRIGRGELAGTRVLEAPHVKTRQSSADDDTESSKRVSRANSGHGV